MIKPDIWDPQLNPLYAKLLEHYGVVALPCRPYAPDLKGKVESAVGYTHEYARNTPAVWQHWRNPVKYTTLEEIGIEPADLEWEKTAQPVRRSSIPRTEP